MELRTALIGACLSLTASLSWADDVTETINGALNEYRQNNYGGAVEELNIAIQQIQYKKAEQLSEFFPDGLPGWRSESVEHQAPSAGMFSGVMLERNYEKGNAHVEVSMTTGSPLVQSVMGYLSNPMLAGAMGVPVNLSDGQKGFVQYKKERQSGEMIIIVDKRYHIEIRGKGVDRETLIKFGKAFNFSKLKSVQ